MILNIHLENKPDLDGSIAKLNHYETENKQYLYDSDLHPELLENELITNYVENEWCQVLMEEIRKTCEKHDLNKHSATHIGCSTGYVGFKLSNQFESVSYILKILYLKNKSSLLLI